MGSVRLMRLFRTMALAMLLVFCGSACGNESVGTSVVGYNHTDKNIASFVVKGGPDNQGGGGFLEAHSGGGGFSCCISVPKPWRPGLKVVVGWTDAQSLAYQERQVPVPEYDARNTAQMSVHFLRNGEIKVFVPPFGLGNPNYPLKGPEAGLYPGEDPVDAWRNGHKRPKLDEVSEQIKWLKKAGADTFGIPPDKLQAFVAEHLAKAKAHGILNEVDQTQYLILAISTSGHFVEDPYVKERLAKPESEHDTPFGKWVMTVPESTYEIGRSFRSEVLGLDAEKGAVEVQGDKP